MPLRRRPLLSLTLALALSAGGMTAPGAMAAAKGVADQQWEAALSFEKQQRWREAAEAGAQSAEAEQASPQPRWEGYARVVGTSARCYLQSGDPEQACRVLEKGTTRLRDARQAPFAVPLFNQLGRYRKDMGDLDAAQTAHQAAVAGAREANTPGPLAVSLSRLGMVHTSAGRYAEAVACYDEALPIARRLNDEAMLSDLLAGSGAAHSAWGRHARALVLLDESLAISRKRGDAYETAYTLSDLAALYAELGRYDQAIAHAEESIQGFRRLGNQKGLAMALGNLASVQEDRGRYPEARATLEEVLRLQRAEGLKIAEITTLHNLAGLDVATGHYDQALQRYEQALAMARSLGREPQAAITLNDMGTAHMALGQYDLALGRFESALAIERRLGREPSIAVALSNVGQLYRQWGRPDLAEPMFEQALALDRAGDRRIRVAESLSNISGIHLSLGRTQQALVCEVEALGIYRQQQAEAEVGTSLNSLGAITRELHLPDRALTLYQQGLAINRRLGRESEAAASLRGIGAIHLDAGRYAASRDHVAQALAIYRRLNRPSDMANALSYLAIADARLGATAQAIAELEEAVTLLDGLRKTAKGELRRDYMAITLNTYQHLVDLHARAGHAEAALEASERSRAKLLGEMLAGQAPLPTPGVAALRAELPIATAVLIYANAAQTDRVQMALTREGLLTQVQAFKPATSSPAPTAKPSSATPAAAASPGANRGAQRLDEPDNAEDLAGLVADYRQALLKRDAGRTRALGRALYDALILPLEAQLKGKTALVVIPDASLGFVPFEGLVDPQGRYVAERFAVTYAHSLAVRSLLAQRRHPAGRKPLLAFGGARYQPVALAERGPATPATPAARQSAYQTLSRGASMADAYDRLGLGRWAELPGTLREVTAIAALQPGTAVVTGEHVSESRVKAMAASGELAGYRVLHFATHGLTVPEVPELSALVLSQLADQPGGEDGYLRASEVSALKLAADFVNLSACETGLGKLYGGEGVVGLSQAFLLAGANGLSMSLWSVADDSTATFMTELYKTAAKDGVGHAEAASRVKRRFIRGEFGETYKQPFYWAPFVHYGL